METVPQRKLTAGEKALLRPIFINTLPYDDQFVARNDDQTGGPFNSFTPGFIPNMAISLWSLDYSTASSSDKWVFIHEMTHVWQAFHGDNNIINGIKIWASHSSYDDAYYYDLTDNSKFRSYNMEQQASIVADYWYVLNGVAPDYNTNRSAQGLNSYQPFINQLQTAGPPLFHDIKRNPDKEFGFRI
jgi:hypothetical protein